MTSGCLPLTPGAVAGLAFVVNPGQREVKVHHELRANRWSDTSGGDRQVGQGRKRKAGKDIYSTLTFLP